MSSQINRYQPKRLGRRPLVGRSRPVVQHSRNPFHRMIRATSDQIAALVPRKSGYDPEKNWSDSPTTALYNTTGQISERLCRTTSPETVNELLLRALRNKRWSTGSVKKLVCSQKPLTMSQAVKTCEAAKQHKTRDRLVCALGGDQAVLNIIEAKKNICEKLEVFLKPLMEVYYSTSNMEFSGSQFERYKDRHSEFGRLNLLKLAVIYLQDADVIDALLRCDFAVADIREAEREAVRAGDYMNAAKLHLAANHKENPDNPDARGCYFYFVAGGSNDLEKTTFDYYQKLVSLSRMSSDYTYGMIVEYQPSENIVSSALVGGDINHWYVFAPNIPNPNMDYLVHGGEQHNGIYSNPNNALADACRGNRLKEYCHTSIPARINSKLDTAVKTIAGGVVRGGLSAGASLLAGESESAASFAGFSAGVSGAFAGFGEGENNHARLNRVIGMAAGGALGLCFGAPVAGIMIGDTIREVMVNLDSPEFIRKTIKDVDGTLCSMIILKGVSLLIPGHARGIFIVSAGVAAVAGGTYQGLQEGLVGETIAALIATAGASLAIFYGASLHFLRPATAAELIGVGSVAIGLEKMKPVRLITTAVKASGLPFRIVKSCLNRFLSRTSPPVSTSSVPSGVDVIEGTEDTEEAFSPENEGVSPRNFLLPAAEQDSVPTSVLRPRIPGRDSINDAYNCLQLSRTQRR